MTDEIRRVAAIPVSSVLSVILTKSIFSPRRLPAAAAPASAATMIATSDRHLANIVAPPLAAPFLLPLISFDIVLENAPNDKPGTFRGNDISCYAPESIGRN